MPQATPRCCDLFALNRAPQEFSPVGSCKKVTENGLPEDDVQARAWYELSAAARNPRGMGTYGECLLCGVGGPKDCVLGLVMATQAAGLGSEVGAYQIGQSFFKGSCGLQKDPSQARFWLKKVVDGCAHKHLSPNGRADAAKWLRELDGAGE